MLITARSGRPRTAHTRSIVLVSNGPLLRERTGMAEDSASVLVWSGLASGDFVAVVAVASVVPVSLGASFKIARRFPAERYTVAS